MSEKKQKYERNKGGRPKINEEHRLEPFTIRLSKFELDKLHKNYNNLKGIKETFSKYLRAILTKGKVNVIYINESERKIVTELVKIGNNLNQIAKHVNQQSEVKGEEIALNKIQKSLDDIYKTYYGEKD